MRFLRNLVLGRSSRIGLLSDLAMVAGAAARVAKRGSSASTAAAGAAGRRSSGGVGEWILVGGAALRLLRRIRRVRRTRRLNAAATVVD